MMASTKISRIYPRLDLDITTDTLIKSLLGIIQGDQQQITTFWNSQKTPLISLSVRTAFDLYLQTTQLPPHSEVLLSGVNIENMVEIVQHHHLIPVPVDLELDTLAPNLEQFKARISPKTRLCLIAHLFGSIIDLTPYLNYCKPAQIPLIEDCAQAFAGRRYLGHPEADGSLFSFGVIKSCTALGGAVSLWRDADLVAQMTTIQEQYPQKSDSSFKQRLLKYYILKNISRPWVYHKLLWLLEKFQQDVDQVIGKSARGFSGGDLLSNIRYRPAQHLLNLLVYRLTNLPNYDIRISLARNFLKYLDSSLTLPGSKAPDHSFWLFPILVSDPGALMGCLRQAGFDATRGSTSLRAIRDPVTALPLPQSAYLLNHILYLPLFPGMSESEQQRLIECVQPHIIPPWFEG